MSRKGGQAEKPGGKHGKQVRQTASLSYNRILFVTGKLAEPALRRMLVDLAPAFGYEVAVLKITVAALMTTPWIAKFLEVPPGTDLILLPGLVEGETAILSERFGVTVQKGPKDLRELPQHFGQDAPPTDYGEWDIEILAEINNAPKRTPIDVRAEADYYRASGADIIDVGCTPGVPFPGLGDLVHELKTAGMRVSIDSFDPTEIRAAIEAGAELVLSVNRSNLEVIEGLRGSGARVVAMPDLGTGLESLEPTLNALERAGVPFLIDPIIEPIGFGFMASLERYAEVHRHYPDASQLMGIGNITELTSADTTGVHAILLAVCQEVGVRAVLTTEVIPWARGAVREIDIARRLMYHAVTRRTLPKKLDDRLVTLKDPRILAYTDAELRELQAQLKDANFRIFADGKTITVFNHALFVQGTEIQEIFDQLGVTEAGHAFYLGKELARAKLSIVLGKTYRQEGPLAWGYLTPPDDPIREHFKPTMRNAGPTGAPKERRSKGPTKETDRG